MLLPAGDLPDIPAGIDTLLVCGGPGAQVAERDERLIGWLRDAAGRSRRVASVCTGALLLARAGLLDGRRATTHWAACRELAERYPQVTVERDAIFVRDGRMWTSAGVTAGMDLALALVEKTSVATSRWRSRAGWCCSSSGPADSRSSPPTLPASARAPIRCAR